MYLGLKGEEDKLEERTAFTLNKSMLDIFDLNNIDRHWEYNMSDKKSDAIYSKIKTDQMKRLKRIIKKENFPQFTLNMIRHSWAKRAIKSKFFHPIVQYQWDTQLKSFRINI